MPTILVPVLLKNGTKTLVEASVDGAARDEGQIGWGQRIAEQSLTGLTSTIEGFAQEFSTIWEAVKPEEASIELSFKATYDSGVLLGVLVRGNAEANVKVTLKWKPS